MQTLRYLAAACQTDQPNPLNRPEMTRNTARKRIDDAKRKLGYLQEGEKVAAERINDVLTASTKRRQAPRRSAQRRGSLSRRSS